MDKLQGLEISQNLTIVNCVLLADNYNMLVIPNLKYYENIQSYT